MQVIVDNSAGDERAFADEVASGLRERGFEVELRQPTSTSSFDTAVHLVSSGIVVRVSERPDRSLLSAIEEVVRAALLHRASMRRRMRTVPVALGESHRVIDWIDVVE